MSRRSESFEAAAVYSTS